MTVSTTAHAHPSELTRRARLSPPESQQAFRALLDALARPGRVVRLPVSLTERGARVSIACRSLRAPGARRPAGAGLTLTLRGPGVKGTVQFVTDGLDPAPLEALADANRPFPAGVDAWLVADDGSVVGLPRSTKAIAGPSHDFDAAPDPDHDQGAR